jgi:hypothetical protein
MKKRVNTSQLYAPQNSATLETYFARATGPSVYKKHMAKRSEKKQQVKKKNPAAVALAMLGASKGGKARAAKLSAKRRSEIARKAGAARITKISPERRKEIAQKAAAARMTKISPERRREIALKASHSRRFKK